VSGLSDAALARLRSAAGWPEFTSDRYTVIDEIERGGMGTVYRAADTLLAREVALKVPNGFGGSAVERSLRVEAGVLARLEHPGIVPIHDAGVLADGRLFYVMKLVRGETLAAFLHRVGDIDERLGVFERICEPVAFAHAHGFVHRDLKPDNVMLGPFGEVLVMDWGAALLNQPVRHQPLDRQPHTGQPAVVGTRGFMAPEQAAAADVDGRADVYSLGVLLFLLLTNTTPMGAEEPSPVPLPRSVPPPLRSICARAMARAPDQRYQEVAALARDVRRYRAGQPVEAHEESLLERTARIGRTHRIAILLVAAYLVMRVVVAITMGR
jgi:eukaryotic-like serine/threonine-protein kinase